MKGDVILIEEHHRAVARLLLPLLLPLFDNTVAKITFTVAGESGSGKSETAAAISETLSERGISSAILQQDDYFHLPPTSNHNQRLEDLGKVGPAEVNLELLNSHIQHFRIGKGKIHKPLVDYDNNKICEETIHLDGVTGLIVEGTYTSLLDEIDRRIFIARDFNQTLDHRRKRNRSSSELNNFINEVLMIEHQIIATHQELADIIINDDYSVQEKKIS